MQQILGLDLAQQLALACRLRRLLDIGAEARSLHPIRRSMILSSPTKAPPQMNRMFVVSICRNSCCGCFRPPFGGTFAIVPSMILSSACCTPSPDTSRVIDGFSLLRAILSISSM